MKTALEMKNATQAYKRAAEEQTRKLLTSWIEHQVADEIDTAVANMKYSVMVRIPSIMAGQNDYIHSYLEGFGYQVSITSEMVHISWANPEQ